MDEARGLISRILLGMALICVGAGIAGCGESSDDYVDFDSLPGGQQDPGTGMTIMSVKLPPGPGVPVEEGDVVVGSTAAAAEGTPDSGENAAEQAEVGDTMPLESGASNSVPENEESSSDASTEAAGSQSTGTGRTVTSEQSGLTGPADRPVIESGQPAEIAAAPAIEVLIPRKRFLKERGTEALRVTYDDIDLLKVLNMEPVPANAQEFFPDWLQNLDGAVIRIRGFMYPTFLATGLTEFAMARDNGICCFVRQPKIYDIISVSLAEGETTDYIANRPFDVEGVFRIDPESDESSLTRLYRIEQARVLQ